MTIFIATEDADVDGEAIVRSNYGPISIKELCALMIITEQIYCFSGFVSVHRSVR